MSDGDDKASFLDGLTFSPDWAKKSSEGNYSNFNKFASGDDGGRRDSHQHRSGPRSDRDDRGPRASRDGRPERRFGSPPAAGDRPRPAPQRRDFSDFPSPRPQHDTASFRPSTDRGADRPARTEFSGGFDRAPAAPVPFDIRFLPDQKALSVIAHKVQAGHRAIPLRNLVKLFFENPDSTDVRLEFNAENKDKRFYQCSTCGWFSLSEDDLRAHILSTHFADYFVAEEIEVDPPSGKFSSVGRCGFTGKLLAPPNHHSYAKRILQMLRTECIGKTEEEYRSRIELVTDPEVIEKWRQECTKQTVYSPKPQQAPQKPREPKKPVVVSEKTDVAPEATVEATTGTEPASEEPVVQAEASEAPAAEPIQPTQPAVAKLSLEEAEELFSRTIMPKLIRSERQVTATHVATKAMKDRTILGAIARAWDREQAIQTASLFFAVRGGLRSRKLSLFRASDQHREEFVMHKTPTALDASHAVPELKLILDYITAHQGCTKTEMLAELIKNDTSPELADSILKQIAFVTERGYVIEYFNGVLALPEEHPFFANPQKPQVKPAPKESRHEDERPVADVKAEPVEAPAETAPVAEVKEEEVPAEVAPIAEPAVPEEASETKPEA